MILVFTDNGSLQKPVKFLLKKYFLSIVPW